jgi:cation transport ATPase
MALTATDGLVDVSQVERSTELIEPQNDVDVVRSEGLNVAEVLLVGALINQVALSVLSSVPYFVTVEGSIRPLKEFILLVLTSAGSVGVSLLVLPVLFGKLSSSDANRRDSKIAWISAIALVSLAASFVLGLFGPLQVWGGNFYQGIAISLIGGVLAVSRRVAAGFSEMGIAYSLVSDRAVAREVRADGNVQKVNVRSIERYSELLIDKGEVIHLDGEVVEGSAEVLERRFSGALFRKLIQTGDFVLAGSIIKEGSLKIKVMHTAEELTGSLAEPIVRRSHEDISKVEARLDSWVYIAAAAVVFFAACAFNYWMERGLSIANNLQLFGLIVAGAMVFRTGFLTFGAQTVMISQLFLRGVLLRRADVMRRLARVKSLVVDYRSSASPRLMKIEAMDMIDSRYDKDELIRLISAILARSMDLNNQALANKLAEGVSNCSLLREVDNFVDSGLKGVIGQVRGVDITVGQEAMLVERGIALEVSEVVAPLHDEMIVYVAIGSNLVSRIRITYTFQNYLARMVSASGSQSSKVSVLSGESSDSLAGFADKADLDFSDVVGSLSRASYEAALVERAPCSLLLNKETPDHYMPVVDCSIVHFDEVRCELEEADVVLFSEEPSLVSYPIQATRQFSYLNRVFLVGVVVAGILGLFAAANPLVGLFGLLLSVAMPLIYISGIKLLFRQARF